MPGLAGKPLRAAKSLSAEFLTDIQLGWLLQLFHGSVRTWQAGAEPKLYAPDRGIRCTAHEVRSWLNQVRSRVESERNEVRPSPEATTAKNDWVENVNYRENTAGAVIICLPTWEMDGGQLLAGAPEWTSAAISDVTMPKKYAKDEMSGDFRIAEQPSEARSRVSAMKNRSPVREFPPTASRSTGGDAQLWSSSSGNPDPPSRRADFAGLDEFNSAVRILPARCSLCSQRSAAGLAWVTSRRFPENLQTVLLPSLEARQETTKTRTSILVDTIHWQDAERARLVAHGASPNLATKRHYALVDRQIEAMALEHRIGEATIYAWKSKHGGSEMNEAQRLKDLEGENQCLKHLVANYSLNKPIRNTMARKNL
jgi:putative transposase